MGIYVPPALPKPSSYRKQIVVIGGSTADGAGSTVPANSWTGLLSALLTGRGWSYTNLAVGGSKTADGIASFYSSVAPYNADFVLFFYTLLNEGITGAPNPQTIYDTYIHNTKQLARMCEQQGSTLVLMGALPNNGYGATEYAWLKKQHADFEAMGLPVIDFLGVLNDGTGKYGAGLSGDGTHPNDTGHAAIYHAIVPRLFDALLSVNGIAKRDPEGGAIYIGADIVTDSPLSYSPEDTLLTFATAFSVRKRDATNGQAALGLANGGGTARIRFNPPYQYVGADGVTATPNSTVNPATDQKWHRLLLTHSETSHNTDFYVDGVLIGTVNENLGGITGIQYLGRWGNTGVNMGRTEIKDVRVWRSYFSAADAQADAAGKVIASSLELDAPCSDKVFGTLVRGINLAPSYASLVQATGANMSQVAAAVRGKGDIFGRMVHADGFARLVQTLAFAAAVTPDLSLGEIVQITYTGSFTINAAVNDAAIGQLPAQGQRITFRLVHDATANAYVITWGASYKRAGGAFANTNAANAVDMVTFEFDGTEWNEVGRALNVS